MAELIKNEMDLDAALEVGRRGEFSVAVDGRVVARKLFFRFPSDQKVLEQVRRAIAAAPPQRPVSSQG